MRRVLVTGPVERIAEWCSAARDAGWEPIEFPLVEVVLRDVDPKPLFAASVRFDWICITSSNVLPFLERALAAKSSLMQAEVAVVGQRSAERAAQIGLAPTIEPAASAHDLFLTLSAKLTPQSRVLWPHGDRSDDFARELRALGCDVVDPIVYETRALDDRAMPECEAVFFASPSAVATWHERERAASEPPLAIAIGPTTLDALYAETETPFERTLALAAPTPEALAHALAHIDPA